MVSSVPWRAPSPATCLVVDIVIQRVIEVFLCLPTLPLWMALSAAPPRLEPCQLSL